MALSLPQTSCDVSLGQAVVEAVLYSDLFDTALTAEEVHRFLPRRRVAEKALAGALEDELAAAALRRHDGLIALEGREHLIPVRRRRLGIAARQFASARRWSRLIARMPFVRMIAVTGTLAAASPEADDDIDYLFVTEPGRLWTSRLFVVAIARLARAAGVRLCPNYFLACDALQLEERNLYTARELAQMVPLYGEQVCRRMRELNRWAEEHFPQAVGPPSSVAWIHLDPISGALKRLVEAVLRWKAFDAIEAGEMRRRIRRLRRHLTPGCTSARFDARRCKSHFDDYGPAILARHRARLREYGLEESLDG